VLSARFLRSGKRGRVVAMAAAALRVAAATAGRNVHAVGIGRKMVEGSATESRCVRLYVVQKIAPSLLAPRDRLPTDIDGIPTDVIQSPPAFFLKKKKRKKAALKAPGPAAAAALSCTQNRRKMQRPVVAGISAAHHDVTAGTIAYFCRSTRAEDDPAQVYVLSNNHVFADVNEGSQEDKLYQPGPLDGGTEVNHFADLERFVRMELGGNQANRVDAAIGALRAGIAFRPEICLIGAIAGTAAAEEQMVVRKHGRTFGYTEGIVTDVSYDALVGVDHSNPDVVAKFVGQIRIERIDPFPHVGLGGDSGSLVVSKAEPKAVGLYFAGPESGVYGIANPIRDVLDELEIALVSEE